MSSVAALWNRCWFTPASARSLRATRIILAAHALWVVLSKPDIPHLVSWPAVFFDPAQRAGYLRFGIVRGGEPVEWMLYAILHVTLAAVIAGALPRIMCAISALLLYHFAPFEEVIIGMPHTHFAGLTVATIGLFILAFAEVPPANGDAMSPEYRWPVTLIQLIYSFIYLFAFLSKIRFNGIRWFTWTTIRAQIAGNWGVHPNAFGMQVATRPLLCWAIVIATLLFESLFWLCVFMPRLRLSFVLAAIGFHIGILLTMNIHFASAPLLLLFVNWDSLAERLRSRRKVLLAR